MKRSWRWAVGTFGLGALLLSAPLKAQNANLDLGSSYDRYSRVEQDLTKELPNLRNEVKTILQTLNQKGALADDLKSLDDNMQSLTNTLSKLRDDPSFDQIESSLDQINNSLKQAQVAYKNKQLAKAKTLLKKSAVYIKVLVDSPLMKMTQAEIDMDQASVRVGNKDYVAAGLFVNEALDHLQGINIQGNPKLNDQLTKVKSQLVVLHQQAMLGKYKDDKDSKAIWRNMKQVQVDSLSHYYDMWSNTYNPIEP